ncbi:MAG: sigma 54-dependent Fis family transcriptional regulator [Planctomycetia bacterium]|nr:sigma 54-dependent Fis family transcriptional regulator [Planctomycetia bacterium]
MYTYLTIQKGERAGQSFLLDPKAKNHVGRDPDCTLVLADPLCSRVHSCLEVVDGRWRIRDQSRNGTFLSGQRIEDAELTEGCEIQVGSTGFSFHQSEQPPTIVEAQPQGDFTETIVKDVRVDGHDSTAQVLAMHRESEQVQDLYVLYDASVRLLSVADAREVVRLCLELMQKRTEASLAGFLWLTDEGQLKPKVVLAQAPLGEVHLSQSLTHLVTQERRAVWVARQPSGSTTESLQPFSDALCVPLVFRDRVLGAIHLYLQRGRFRQSHFDFAIALCNIAAAALARARQEESLQTSLARWKADSAGTDELLGRHAGIVELKAKIMRVAQASGCVLVRGESGVGKELVARAVHRASARADRPLLTANCAAFSENLLESALFGHKAGAFTGADRDHAGLFQQADLGTLFLDEIGELSLAAQAKLLRILEGHPFLPLGSTEEVRVDVRVIAATNKDLARLVREKLFREDLYYRLGVFELLVPPLRQREGDVELLVDHFLDHFRRQHGRPKVQLSPEARQRLLAHSWPGNVRQLRNVIDSAVVLAAGNEIQVSDLALSDAGGDELESLRIDYWERKLIAEALRRADGNVPEAAGLLGIGRATLYRKIEEYQITR